MRLHTIAPKNTSGLCETFEFVDVSSKGQKKPLKAAEDCLNFGPFYQS
jgi:hypothetical protein